MISASNRRVAAIAFANEQGFTFRDLKALEEASLPSLVGWVMGWASITAIESLPRGELGRRMRAWEERSPYTLAELDDVLTAAAYLATRHGSHHLSLFQRVEREIVIETERQAALARAVERYDGSYYHKRDQRESLLARLEKSGKRGVRRSWKETP